MLRAKSDWKSTLFILSETITNKMEEQKTSLSCQNWDRADRVRFYCATHSKQLWFKWATTLHLECQREDIEEQVNVRESIRMVSEGLCEIIQEAQELQADSHIQDFSSQIQKYQESLQSLENKVDICVTH